jgi:hypothetical protein
MKKKYYLVILTIVVTAIIVYAIGYAYVSRVAD